MSDWEDFCDGMGWRNDEHATDKPIDYIEGKNQRIIQVVATESSPLSKSVLMQLKKRRSAEFSLLLLANILLVTGGAGISLTLKRVSGLTMDRILILYTLKSERAFFM